jgi:hypothetical protein
MENQTYIVGPVVPVGGKKKDRKREADALARQLMKLLSEDYDIIEIRGYKFGDDDE